MRATKIFLNYSKSWILDTDKTFPYLNLCPADYNLQQCIMLILLLFHEFRDDWSNFTKFKVYNVKKKEEKNLASITFLVPNEIQTAP